jgi:drug/metabolite transporter (DMT)-like permease
MPTDLFVFVLLSAVLHATWNFVARRNAGNLTVFWWSLWISGLVLLPFVAGVAVSQGTAGFLSMLADGWLYVLATGIIHSFYFLLLARAYQHGEISLVYPIARGSGIGLTGFLGWLLLDESLTPFGVSGIALICIGILSMGVSILRHARDARHGFVSALGVGATIVSYSLVDKVGVSIVHPVVYIFGMFMLSAALVTPLVAVRDRGRLWRKLGETWRSATLIGVGSTAAYLMILFAMTVGQVGYIVALREFAVVLGAMLGFIFLKERITPMKVGAVLMIVAGLVCIKLG